MSDLPAGWRRTTLGDAALWGSGGTPTAGDPRYYGGQVPWVVIGDLSDGSVSTTRKTLTGAGLAASSAKWVTPQSVLMAMYGSIGKLGIAEVAVTTNQAIAFASPHDDVLTKYLFYYLLGERDRFLGEGKGATQKNISQTIIKSWPFPLAPMSEQRRIVDVLENHLSHLDAAAASLEACRQRLDVMNLSYLAQARRRLLDEGSPVVRLAEVCDSTLGKMLDVNKAIGVQTPYLRNINVRWGAFDLDDIKTMPMVEADIERLSIKDGDVLVCEGGEPGRCAVWRGGSNGLAFQKALHRLRVKDAGQIQPPYLSLMLEEHVRSGRVTSALTGTTIKHLPQEKLRLIEIPGAPLEAQMNVVKGVEHNLDAARRLAADIHEARSRSRALRSGLLTAAFSGRLTGRSTDTEVVEEIADSQGAA